MSDEPPTKSLGTTSSPSRKVWEYTAWDPDASITTGEKDPDLNMNQMGSEGWELCAINVRPPHLWIFKREKLG